METVLPPRHRPSRENGNQSPRPCHIPDGPFYRHSRVSGNLAVACQDCGIIRQYRRDSRLRGNDGQGGAGRTVGGGVTTVSRVVRYILLP